VEKDFRVGNWVVRPERLCIHLPGKTVHITPKSMAVLQCLAQADNGVVSRNDLLDKVWPGAAVTDDVLTHCIVELRKAFGDSAQDSRFIETIPKKGFRLMAKVGAVDAGQQRPRVTSRIAVAAIAIVGIVGVWYLVRDSQLPSANAKTIAVLPLDSYSADPEQEYFTDGMTDVLTNELAQIGGLRVISRTSAMRYKATDKSLPEIARELNVDILIEGSVQQSGEDVLFTLQLIDGRTDRHLWSDSYKRPLQDVLTLQGEVAYAIAQAVQVTLTPRDEARLARKRSTDSNAIRMWAVGNHHLKDLEGDSFYKALRAYEEAASHDPGFADAYAGIARATAYLGSWHATAGWRSTLPPAKAAAEKAIQIDPDIAEAHFVLGLIHIYEWNWDAADREYRMGLTLNPSDSIGLTEYANFLTSMGRFDEAIEVATLAVEIDLYSPVAHNELGNALWFGGQRDAGIEQFEKALQLDPEFHQTLWILADSYFLAGDFVKALEFMDKFRESAEPQTPNMIGIIGHHYAALGRSEDARDILSALLRRRETEYVHPTALAYVFTGLEENDEALRWLEIAYAERDNSLQWLKYDPNLDSLRSEPRFQDILARMNFPDARQTVPD